MIDNEFETMFDDKEYWSVYDNEADEPVAFGSYDETVKMLKMNKDEFEGMLSRFDKGERTFDILGRQLSVNIMVDGRVYRGARD